MSDGNPRLVLTLYAGRDNAYRIELPLHEHVIQEIERISPPSPFDLPVGGTTAADRLDLVSEVLRRREFRKALFISECKRIGTLLAERMEDAEGWHDIDRIEPAKAELANRGGRQ